LKAKVVVTGPTMLLKRLKEAYPEAAGILESQPMPEKKTTPPIKPRHATVRVAKPPTAIPETPAPVIAEPPKAALKPTPEEAAKKAKQEVEQFFDTVMPTDVPPVEPGKEIPEEKTPAKQQAATIPEVIGEAIVIDEDDVTLNIMYHVSEAITDAVEPWAEEIDEQVVTVISGETKKKSKKGRKK